MFIAVIEHESVNERTGSRFFQDHLYGPFETEQFAWAWLIARGDVDSDYAHDVLPLETPHG